MEKKEYVVIAESGLFDFINSVNDFLKKGWRCQGGIMVTPDKIFYQAMVRTSLAQHDCW